MSNKFKWIKCDANEDANIPLRLTNIKDIVVLMTSVKAKINVGLNGREQFLIVPAANLPLIEI